MNKSRFIAESELIQLVINLFLECWWSGSLVLKVAGRFCSVSSLGLVPSQVSCSVLFVHSVLRVLPPLSPA